MGLTENRIKHRIYFVLANPRIITKNALPLHNVLILQGYGRRHGKRNFANKHLPQKQMRSSSGRAQSRQHDVSINNNHDGSMISYVMSRQVADGVEPYDEVLKKATPSNLRRIAGVLLPKKMEDTPGEERRII